MIEKKINNLKKCKQIVINRIVKNTRVEGFGCRYCIWVQGCSIHCPQCANQDMWDKKQGKIYDIDEIVVDILKQECNIEGVTFLGGEPFEQAEALAIIAERIREKGYSVITFTGYEYISLQSSLDKDIQNLLKHTDLLIDGPFKIRKLDYSRPWVGSSNQRYIFLSDRYKREDLKEVTNRFEIRINNVGKVEINGMGDYKKVIKFLEGGIFNGENKN